MQERGRWARTAAPDQQPGSMWPSCQGLPRRAQPGSWEPGSPASNKPFFPRPAKRVFSVSALGIYGSHKILLSQEFIMRFP